MVTINKRNPKEGRFQPQFGKNEIWAGCPSNAAGWARRDNWRLSTGRLNQSHRNRRSCMETRQEEKKGGNPRLVETNRSMRNKKVGKVTQLLSLKEGQTPRPTTKYNLKEEKSTRQRLSSSSSSTFKTRGVSGNWKMVKDWMGQAKLSQEKMG